MLTNTSFPEQITQYLSKHKIIAGVLAILYSLLIVYMHNPIVNLSIWIMNALSLPIYNMVVGIGSIVFFLAMIGLIALQFRKEQQFLGVKIFYLLINLLFIFIHVSMMFEMNIEIIHSIEFSVLAYLMFCLTQRVGMSLLLALPVILIDEWRQYIVLYPSYVMYFEFNDIVIDILGSGLFLLIISFWKIYPKNTPTPIWKLPEIMVILGVLIMLAILVQTGYFAFYSFNENSNSFFTFNKLPQHEQFWSIHPFTKARYHILTPIEGISAIVILFLFYLSWDRFYQFKPNISDSTK